MQILIIKLPAGEQISSLSYKIDSEEVLFGQDSACQIQLPDQRQKVARRHGRFYQEAEQWFLECTEGNELLVNQTTATNQRVLLADGELVLDSSFIPRCLDYRVSRYLQEQIQNIQALMQQRASLIAAQIGVEGEQKSFQTMLKKKAPPPSTHRHSLGTVNDLGGVGENLSARKIWLAKYSLTYAAM